jgi:hypothetical protein
MNWPDCVVITHSLLHSFANGSMFALAALQSNLRPFGLTNAPLQHFRQSRKTFVKLPEYNDWYQIPDWVCSRIYRWSCHDMTGLSRTTTYLTLRSALQVLCIHTIHCLLPVHEAGQWPATVDDLVYILSSWHSEYRWKVRRRTSQRHKCSTDPW